MLCIYYFHICQSVRACSSYHSPPAGDAYQLWAAAAQINPGADRMTFSWQEIKKTDKMVSSLCPKGRPNVFISVYLHSETCGSVRTGFPPRSGSFVEFCYFSLHRLPTTCHQLDGLNHSKVWLRVWVIASPAVPCAKATALSVWPVWKWWKAPLRCLDKMGPSCPIIVTFWKRQADSHTCVLPRCAQVWKWGEL